MADTSGFVDAVQSKYKMRPVVPVGDTVKIGHIGRIGRDGSWIPVSTTRARFRVAPKDVKEHKPPQAIWDATSGKDVKFHLYGKGQTSKLVSNVADAKARAEIEFASSKSFAFSARGMNIQEAAEVDDVIGAIRRAYHKRHELPENRRWESDLCFVFAVGSAKRMAAIFAEQAKTDVMVTGKAKVGPPTSAADLSAGVQVGISSKEYTKNELSPATDAFYRAYKLNPSIFRRWDRERQEELGNERHTLFLRYEAKEGGNGGAPPDAKLRATEMRKLEARPLPKFDEVFEPA